MIDAKPQPFIAVRSLVLSLLLFIGLHAVAIPIFAQASGTWTATGSLHTARSGHTATLLGNGSVLIAGGQTSSGFLSSAEIYDPATGTFSLTGSMTSPRLGHSATLLPNGEVLVAGGIAGAQTSSPFGPIYTASAEIYNPATGTWKATGGMTMTRELHGAALLPNGQVLVAGGMSSNGASATTAELYNPATGTWKATGNMPSTHTVPATVLFNGEVLVAGNESAAIYNLATGTWSAASRFYYPSQSGGGAALLLSGDVLIFGGSSPSYASEFYNPSANTWAPTRGQATGNLKSGSLTLLGSGKVLVAGGNTNYAQATIALLYDPSTNTWAATGSMKQIQSVFTLLMNGKVLASGGAISTRNSNGTITVTYVGEAEIYTP